MATSVGEIEATLTLKDQLTPQLGVAQAELRKLTPALATTSTEVQKLGTTSGLTSEAVKGLAVGAATGLAAYVSLNKVISLTVEFLQDSIQSFSDAQVAQQRLTTALQRQGTAVPDVTAAYQQYATELQRTTVFSDDAATEAEALLVIFGVFPSQMQRALKATADLATAMGTDLVSAAKLVGKASDENVRALRANGVQLDDARVKAEGFTYVLGQIEKAMGGQAQDQMKTYAGQVKNLGNAWDDVKEQVGEMLVKSGLLQIGLAAANVEIGRQRGLLSAANILWSVARGAVLDQVTGLAKLGTASGKVTTKYTAQEQAVLDSMFATRSHTKSAAEAEAQARANAQAELDAAEAAKLKAEADEAAAKAAKAHAEEVKKLADVLSGRAVARQMQTLVEAIRSMGGVNAIAVQQLPKLVAQIDEWRKAGLALNPVLDAVGKTTVHLGTIGIPVLTGVILDQIPALKTAKVTWDSYEDAVGIADATLGKFVGTGPTIEETLANIGHAITLTKPTTDWGGALEGIDGLFRQLGQTTRGTFGQVTSGIGLAIGAFRQLQSAVELVESTTATMGERIAGTASAGGALAQLYQIAYQLGEAFHHAQDEAYQFQKQVELLRDVQRDFATGTRRGAGAAVELPGFSDALMAEIAKDLQALASRGGDPAVRRALAEALNLPAIIEELGGLTAQNLQGLEARALPLFDLIRRGGTLAGDATKTLNQLISEFAARSGPTRDSWDDTLKALVKQAHDLGIELDAVRLEAGFMLEHGTKQWKDIQKLAEEYEVDLIHLNSTFQDAKMADEVLKITQAWEDLLPYVNDVDALAKSFADEVQTIVTESFKFSTKIPENMRPLIARLIEMGQLTDENGQKLTDISQINFSQSIESALGDVVDVLRDLISIFKDHFPRAVQEGAHEAEGHIHDFVVNASDQFKHIEFPNADWTGAGFGPDIPVADTPIRPVTRAGLAWLNPGDIAGMPGLTSGSATVIHSHLYLDGREIANSVEEIVNQGFATRRIQGMFGNMTLRGPNG